MSNITFPTNLPKGNNSTKYVSWKDFGTGRERSRSVILIDASGLVLGRLAAYVAHVLRAKDKPDYSPHIRHGDMVVIINAKEVVLTGRKEITKKYYRYSGYRGGLKETTARLVRSGSKPETIIINAVKGMLGRNKIAKHIMSKNLRVYPCSKHLHTAQQPTIVNVAAMNRKNSVK